MSRPVQQTDETKISSDVSRVTWGDELNEMVQYTLNRESSNIIEAIVTYVTVSRCHWQSISGSHNTLVAVHNRSRALSESASCHVDNERSPWKWFKQKFRSVFSTKSPSRNLDVPDILPTSTNVLPINATFLAAQARENSPSDGPRDIADRTGPGE
jgi:hypothetical protein